MKRSSSYAVMLSAVQPLAGRGLLALSSAGDGNPHRHANVDTHGDAFPITHCDPESRFPFSAMSTSEPDAAPTATPTQRRPRLSIHPLPMTPVADLAGG